MTLKVEELYAAPEVVYPDSDGEPMAENTLQFEWIVTIEGGLDLLFRENPDVFVAGDLLWYPVEGDNRTRHAPDAMVVFGRPKGYRGSYRQWQEGGLAPHVVFEVLSPGNTPGEMANKRQWYARYGVEEYYEYDPNQGTLQGWLFRDTQLVKIEQMQGWVSPRLNVRFGLEGSDLTLIGPDGKRFQSYLDVAAERNELAAERNELAAERNELAAQRNELAAERNRERARADRLAARLRELGLDDE